MNFLKNEKILDMYEEEYDNGFYIVTPSGTYRFLHDQDCCEEVSICSDFNETSKNLIGKTIKRIAVREVELNSEEDAYEVATFFDIVTDTYTGTIQFHGESNGYYSVDVSTIVVSFNFLPKNKNLVAVYDKNILCNFDNMYDEKMRIEKNNESYWVHSENPNEYYILPYKLPIDWE